MEAFKAIPELLRRHKLSTVFSVLGGSNVPWIAQGVHDGTLRLVKTRHEHACVNAAIGYSRTQGTTGVCSVIRGPGFANAVNGLVAAARSHAPILLIVSESPVPGALTTQNIDQEALSTLIGTGFHQVSTPDALEGAMAAALAATALDGTPQVLSLSDQLLHEETPLSDDGAKLGHTAAEFGEPDAEPVRSAVEALARAEQPVILAGQGAVLANCRDSLVELAELVGARLATSLRANCMFAGHPNSVGLSGGWASPVAREVLSTCDLVVTFGASLNEFTTAYGELYTNATIVQVESNAAKPVIATSPDLVSHADAGVVAGALVAEWKRQGLPQRPMTGAVPSRAEIAGHLLERDLGHDPDRGIDTIQAYAALDELLPDDRVIVTDAGRFLAPIATLVPAGDARSWLYGSGWGSVGLGLGMAVGAAAGQPDRPVALITGDGGFMMASNDLDAIRLNGLDLLVFIINDEMWGAEVNHLSHVGLPTDVIEQSLPDIPTLARAFGGQGFVVTSIDELKALDLDHRGLTLVDIRVDPQIDVRHALRP